MSFNSLLLALALTVLWPLVLMGVLAAAEWLERRTLTARELPRGLRSAAGAPPEPVQAGVAGADAGMAASWAGTGRGSPAGPAGGSPAGPHGGSPAGPHGGSPAGSAGGSPAGPPGEAPAATRGGTPDGARGPLGSGGLSEPADGERVAARRPAGGGGRHLRRTGGGRHERRG